MTTKMKPLAILKNYFGVRAEEFRDKDPETGLPLQPIKDFARETKNLTAGDKVELVEEAAKELGVEVDWT